MDGAPSVAPVNDLKALQAFVHPLRARLLGLLRDDGPATASELAAVVGESTGSTSYHLRQLARFGFIEDDPDQPKGRARRWRATAEMTRTPAANFIGEPGGRAALEQVIRNQINDVSAAYAAFVSNGDVWGEQWLDATMSTDVTLRLTSDGLRALKEEIHEVVWRHRAAAQEQSDTTRVLVYLSAVPVARPEP